MGSTKPAATRKRRGPQPRGLVKKTIMMSRTRERVIQRAVADGRAPSASGYIEQALEAYATQEDYETLLADWRAEVGPATPEEMQWAADAIRLATAVARRNSG